MMILEDDESAEHPILKEENAFLINENEKLKKYNKEITDELIELKMKEDLLVDIYNHQKHLQLHLGTLQKIKTEADKQEYLNMMFLALFDECGELMRETAFKNSNLMKFGWKKNQPLNYDNAKKELIDILHFVFNIAIVLGMKPQEIHDIYINKNKINVERKNEGY